MYSANSPSICKRRPRHALKVFHTLCCDPRALVEIFLNYDCNLENVDLFRRIVLCLAKVGRCQSRAIPFICRVR